MEPSRQLKQTCYASFTKGLSRGQSVMLQVEILLNIYILQSLLVVVPQYQLSTLRLFLKQELLRLTTPWATSLNLQLQKSPSSVLLTSLKQVLMFQSISSRSGMMKMQSMQVGQYEISSPYFCQVQTMYLRIYVLLKVETLGQNLLFQLISKLNFSKLYCKILSPAQISTHLRIMNLKVSELFILRVRMTQPTLF